MKLRRLLSILAALAMVLSLMAVAGCGKKPAAGGVVANDNAEEEFFLDMPSELQGTTVKFATWIDHSQTDTAAVLAGFEQTTGMKYEWVNVSQGEYIEKLIGLIAADQAPDVIVENGDFPNTLALLMPLEVETTGMDVKDPFWNQDLANLFTFGGKCYLVNGANSTWNMGGAVTYYNRTILEENGLNTPGDLVADNDWNLASLKKLMQQIEQRAGLENKSAIDATVFLAMHGATETYIDLEKHEFANGINTPQAQAALKWLNECKDEDLVEIILSGSHSSLGDGSAAIQIAGAYGLRNKPGWFYAMDYDDLGFAPLPKISAEDADYPRIANTRAYGICKGSKNPKGAAYFLRYFLNGNNYDKAQVFKNDEATKLWEENVKSMDYSCANFDRGVRMTVYPDQGGLTDGNLGKILWSSTDQYAVNLASCKNIVDTCVAKGNELLAAKVDEDK